MDWSISKNSDRNHTENTENQDVQSLLSVQVHDYLDDRYSVSQHWSPWIVPTNVYAQKDEDNALTKAESISLSKVKQITEIQQAPQELCLYQAGNAYGNEIKHQQEKS